MEIFHENTDTNESIYSFFQNQEDETKKWIDFDFILSDDYNDYFMKYLVNIKDGEDEKYDMLTNKNSKVWFYHFNDYLRQINEPIKPVINQSNNGSELTKLVSAKEAKIIENSIEKLTICKTLYTNFYNEVAGNLSKAIRNLPSDELD